MYTIVLAAFLTAGHEVPDFGRRGGCRGCYGGCWGGCYGGCYGCGGGWGGCYGGGCWGGCYGGGCGGCYGGCWGGGYGGCWGSCYGCGGGCYGGMVVYPASAGGCTGMSAGGGTSSGGGGSAGQGGGSSELSQTLKELKTSIEELKKEQNKLRIEALKQTAEALKLKATEQKIDELRRTIEELRRRLPPRPGAPVPVPVPRPRPELPPPQPGKGEVRLEMPADALVLVNDKRLDASATFLTPELKAGEEFMVKVEAVVLRNGKSLSRVQRLPLHAGEVVRLAYVDMEPAEGRWTATGQKAAAPAYITVRLPADARLNVQGVDCPLTSDTRTFDTPVLEPGQKYSYLLRAEVLRDGRTVSQTQRVTFRSGQRVRVSFEDLGAPSLTAR